MEVSTANDVKLYNLSAGKSMPEWVSERKRRSLVRDDDQLRRRIELLQDFSMPTAATRMVASRDKQYLLTAGVYKPRIRCYDFTQLSMKFERCLGSEVIDMTLLSDDYSKVVLLLGDRQVDFHVQHGFYYSTRIPSFGRTLAYYHGSCELYITAAGPDVYRLNLDQGKFLTPLNTRSSGSSACVLCDEHQLLAIGCDEGVVQCWDPRSSSKAGTLNISREASGSGVTALQFCGPLTLGVGTTLGQVLLYDIRSTRPYQCKDHHYNQPIHTIMFQNNEEEDLVLSADKKALRIWKQQTGAPFTTVEPNHDINHLCHVPQSGLLFMAVEDSSMLSYFIPALGTAPKWCSFLDSLTEELEESPHNNVYDDYKFVTRKELENLGLVHLIGTNMLRAYMHGYFMDIRLYHKARSVANPFAYEEYCKEKIWQKIEEERASRIKVQKLPRVNKSLAAKLMESDLTYKTSSSVLHDDRFASLFTDPQFQVDEDSEEFKLLHPLLSQKERKWNKKDTISVVEVKTKSKENKEQEAEEDEESDDDDNEGEKDHRGNKRVHYQRDSCDATLVSGELTHNLVSTRSSLGNRLEEEEHDSLLTVRGSTLGSKEATFFLTKKKPSVTPTNSQEHRAERKKLRRSASSIVPHVKKRAVYWRGRRIK